MKPTYVDRAFADTAIPKRNEYGNKGSFGKVFGIIGSATYPGALYLAAEAMLRAGAGYVEIACERKIIDMLLAKFPEIIYTEIESIKAFSELQAEALCEKSRSLDSTLIGCGSSVSEGLAILVERLICVATDSPLIIDADALNSISKYSSPAMFLKKARPIVITPHPLEFSRLISVDAEQINLERERYALDFAKKYGCTVVLKGKNTVITDGERILINTSGSSALAKAGTGDVLAGLTASLIASAKYENHNVTELAALACYLHGRAGDELAELYSKRGILTSELPLQIAKILRTFE